MLYLVGCWYLVLFFCWNYLVSKHKRDSLHILAVSWDDISKNIQIVGALSGNCRFVYIIRTRRK